MTQRAINQYELGQRRPTGDILIRLAAALGVSPVYLSGHTDAPDWPDRLPPEWEQVAREAMAQGFTPEEVRRAL